MRARLAVFVSLTLMGSAALAAQHQVPTKILLVKNPPSGARKVLWKVKETGSAATVAGDPIADGATLRVRCEHRLENPTTFCDDSDACTADDYVDYPASYGCVHSPICP